MMIVPDVLPLKALVAMALVGIALKLSMLNRLRPKHKDRPNLADQSCRHHPTRRNHMLSPLFLDKLIRKAYDPNGNAPKAPAPSLNAFAEDLPL